MDEKQEKQESKRGKATKVYLFRCATCPTIRTVESGNKYPIELQQAEKWIREDGWSKNSKLGWMCPTCVARRLAMRR